MDQITAIGFDLFNTLITVESITMERAKNRLTESLLQSGFKLDQEAFIHSYTGSVQWFLDQSKKVGRETHNRFWISRALSRHGFNVPPDDPAISRAVEAYFSAFYPNTHLIPGTIDTLRRLREKYHLGLLSNFTHPPAAMKIIEGLGLETFFDVILISGEIGFRKPHPSVFKRLLKGLGVKEGQTLYIGDDPESDILGAGKVGIQPVWTTYAMDHHISSLVHINPPLLDEKPPGVPQITKWEDLFSLLKG